MEGVDGDEDDAAVGVDAVLGITIADGVKDCSRGAVGLQEAAGRGYGAPEGSFK